MNRNKRSMAFNKKKDIFPVRAEGLSVDVTKHKTFDAAMNKWMRKVQEDGKMELIRERRFYEKPSVKKRKQKAKARLKEKYRRINEEEKHG